MRGLGKGPGRGLACLFLTLAALWLLVPRSGVDREISFDPARLLADPHAWVQQGEQQFSNIRPIPDRATRAHRANLFHARRIGHGPTEPVIAIITERARTL